MPAGAATATLMSVCLCRRAGQHPPNLLKMYPAHAKRVRKAPERYAVEDIAPAAKPSEADPTQTEQRTTAQQVQTHSGKKVDASTCCLWHPNYNNISNIE